MRGGNKPLSLIVKALQQADTGACIPGSPFVKWCVLMLTAFFVLQSMLPTEPLARHKKDTKCHIIGA
jgi:hypothetical protein